MSAGACAHEWTYGGRGSLGDHSDCHRPNRFVCTLCGLIGYNSCASGSEERCPPCAKIKRGDLKAIARSGFIDRPTDRGFFGTLTAPGERSYKGGSVIRWDRAHCMHTADVKCSGKIGCKANVNDLASWHSRLAKNWSYFRQHMRRSLSTITGVSIDSFDVQQMSTYEPQARGALHRHILFRVAGPATEETVRRAFAMYRDEHDFGPQSDLDVIDLSDPESVAVVAGYLAKYVTKGYDSLGDVPSGFNLAAGAHSTSIRCSRRFRPWSASRRWGDTLATCVQRRRSWAVCAGGLPPSSALAPVGRLDSYLEHSTIVPIAGALPPSDLSPAAM